jgi:DNA modification methylase
MSGLIASLGGLRTGALRPAPTWRVIEGDCRAVLATLPADSIQMCVTSPPYYGLRDYGVEGQLGLERTPEEYVARMVETFREVRRVLRPDGTLWLNLGDSYITSPRGNKPGQTASSTLTNPERQDRVPRPSFRRDRAAVSGPAHRSASGLKPGNLTGIPWRVAFALQVDGWWLRADIIWHKPNPMPESVTSRPTKAHEYLFLLAKSGQYFYDAAAIKEPGVTRGSKSRESLPRNGDGRREGEAPLTGKGEAHASGTRSGANLSRAYRNVDWSKEGRNRRSVWTITTKPFSGAHFAVMPPDLVEPCVLAGSRRGDTVLDPFAGSGTVGMVARRLGRSFVGAELNPEYAAMARERILAGR